MLFSNLLRNKRRLPNTSQRSRRSGPQSCPLQVELLERREVPTVSFSLVQGNLYEISPSGTALIGTNVPTYATVSVGGTTEVFALTPAMGFKSTVVRAPTGSP